MSMILSLEPKRIQAAFRRCDKWGLTLQVVVVVNDESLIMDSEEIITTIVRSLKTFDVD